jgi:signal transduction histidine kinase/ActR/RegA family two-component response regulator
MMTKAAERRSPEEDSSWNALQWVHRLLVRPADEQETLPALLRELTAAFDAEAAELRPLSEEGVYLRVGSEGAGWQPTDEARASVRRSRLAVGVSLPGGGQGLATLIRLPDALDWLLWIEDARRPEWTPAEAAALTLAGQTLERWLVAGERSAAWVEQCEHQARQLRLETMAPVARRLAHDLGNVFTGILGFTELSLVHPAPSSALIQSHLHEIFRSAQNGARLTQQLRLFSRRHYGVRGACSPADLLREQGERLQNSPEHRDKLRIGVLPALPTVALDGEHLHHVLAALLDNAVEATPKAFEAAVTAQVVELDAVRCRESYGDLKPGRHVAICIADCGPGMTADQWRRIVVEPLVTTKPKHRGLGLAVAYGILKAHNGGLRLRPRPEGGVEAEILLPVAVPRSVAPPRPIQADEPAQGARVLVVDDDLLVLNLVRATLEQAGCRVKAVSNAEDALRAYMTAHAEPFQLVLSDILMPRVTGLDLARQLLKRDANVRLLFMSGHTNTDFDQLDLSQRFDLLAKPFRPEELLKAVRSAIDHQRPRQVRTNGEETRQPSRT